MRCPRSSKRWNQIYIGLLAGYSYERIARQLKLSIYTVRVYTTSVFRDLGCYSRGELQGNAIRAAVNGKLKVYLTEILGDIWTSEAVKAIRKEGDSRLAG